MRVFIATFLAGVLAVPAFADVMVKQTHNAAKGTFMSATTTETTYIKGNRLRRDTKVGDNIHSTIFDLDAQKMYVFESRRQEADVWDMTAVAAELSRNIDTGNMKASLEPNGQTKRIAGQNATGYHVHISVPGFIDGSKDMSMTIDLSGPIWIVKDAPGTADYMRFYKRATEKGWVFTIPEALATGDGAAQAKAFAEMYRQLADAGGIAYERKLDIQIRGANPFGSALTGILSTQTTTVDSVETTALADDLFAPPPGYKLNVKK